MHIFCEITSRFESCTSHSIRRTMLNVLVPWFYNLELVDSNVIAPTTVNVSSCEPPSATGLGFLPLQTGYGSAEGTQMILNNLFYLTCKFGEEYSAELELLWAILASTWKSNLKIVCRFLFVMVSLASYEMLLHVKRVVFYLSKTCTERLVDELILELECMDSFVTILDKCENVMPFYRYNKPAPVPPLSSEPPPPHRPVEKKAKKNKKSKTYFVNRLEGDDENDEEEEDDDNAVDSNVFLNNEEDSNEDDEDDDDNSDEDDDDDDDDDDDENDNEDINNYDKAWVNNFICFD